MDECGFQRAAELRRGLDEGGVGVVAARAGVGKSACLVQIALSDLLAGAPVLHVSLVDAVSHVRRRYDQVLDGVGCDPTTHLQVERLRHIHGFFDRGFDADHLDKALHFLAEHMEFTPRLVIVDGGSKPLDVETVPSLRRFAEEQGRELWLTAVTPRHADRAHEGVLPPPLDAVGDSLDVVVRLLPEEERVALRIWRATSNGWSTPRLELDPRTMLLRPSE